MYNEKVDIELTSASIKGEVTSDIDMIKRISVVSSIAAIVIAVTTYIASGHILSTVVPLLAANIIAYYCNDNGYKELSRHIMVIAHTTVFAISPHIGYGSFSDIVMLPVLLCLIFMTFDNSKVIFGYFLLIVCYVLFSDYVLIQRVKDGGLYTLPIMDVILTVLIMLCQSFIIYHFFNQLTAYQKYRDVIEDEIIAKNEELERYIGTNLQLENFAHIASHELKTPVRGISNYTGLIKRTAQDTISAEEEMHLDAIIKSANEMYTMTNGLLEMSKLSIIDVHTKTINVQKHIDALVSSRPEIEKYIELGTLPDKITADPDLTAKALNNIVANAIHLKEDSQDFLVKVYGESGDGFDKICVSFHGAKMSDDEIARIMAKDTLDVIALGWSKIRFKIIKRIVEIHRGQFLLRRDDADTVSMCIQLPSVVSSTPKYKVS